MTRILALGFFDGVHIGHAQLFKRAVLRARQTGARACAFTFCSNPLSQITGRPVPLLCSPEERAELIGRCVPEVIIDPFTEETAKTHWKEYFNTVFIGRLQASHLVVGYDYTFGRDGEGTPELLKRYCAERNIGLDVVPAKRIGGVPASSTLIRGLVAEGDMERAALFLGRRYRLSGVVARGRGVGRRLGFPTVNLPLPNERHAPARGVYATLIHWNGGVYPAVTNVGLRPTFGTEGEPSVESTLPNFDKDLYNERIGVDFLRFLRPEKKFDSPEDLAEQIARDCANIGESPKDI